MLCQYTTEQPALFQFQQSLASNGVSLHSEQSTLVVIEQQSLLSELFEQGLDLCVLELNDLLLPLIDHAAEGGQQDVPGLGQVWICSAPNIISFCGSRMKSSG